MTVGSSPMKVAPDAVLSQPDTLETVVVTATRTPKLLKDTPLLTRVISSKDIYRSGKADIAALLEQKLPGVEFSIGMGQNSQINYSGFGGGGVLFLIDGERIAGETLDNPDYSRLNLQNAERVEIVKGAASSLYGSNATGGVINIISARPKQGFHLSLDGRYGSHSAQRYGTVVTYANSHFSNSLDARYDSHGRIRFQNPGDFREAYAAHSWNIRDKATYTFSKDASVSARASYFRRQRKSSILAFDRYSDISAGLSAHWRDFRINYSFDSYCKYDYYPESKEETRDYQNRQNTVHFQYSHEFEGTGTVTAGGDWLDDYLMSYEFSGQSHSQTNLNAYLQWDWHLNTKIWLVPGLRYDWFSASKARRLSPKLSILWRHSNCSLRLNYAAGFRAPNLKELFMNFDMAGIFMIYGNPDLKSETSQNFSLSAEYSKRGYNFTASIFHNLVNNRISYLWSDRLHGQEYINQHRMLIGGIDISSSKAFNFGLTIQGEYVFTYEKYCKGDLKANPARPHAVTAQVDYTREWKNDWLFNATVNFKWMSAVTGDMLSLFSQEPSHRQRYPAYSLLNIMINQSLGRYFTLSVGVDNILNYRPSYYYFNSPLTTGIGGSLGVSFSI